MWISINPYTEPYPRKDVAMCALGVKDWRNDDISTPGLLAEGYNLLESLGITPHEIYLSVEGDKDNPYLIKSHPEWYAPEERNEFLKNLEG